MSNSTSSTNAAPKLYHCAPCHRPFKDQRTLDKHLRCAPAHAKPGDAAVVTNPSPRSLPVGTANHDPSPSRLAQAGRQQVKKTQQQQQQGQQGRKAVLPSSSRNQQSQGKTTTGSISSSSSATARPQTMPQLSKPAPRPEPVAAPEPAPRQEPARKLGPERAPELDTHMQSSKWSTIPLSQQRAELALLSTYCHSAAKLLQNGYRLKPYNNSTDLEYLTTRCTNCNGLEAELRNRALPMCVFHPGKAGGKRSGYGKGHGRRGPGAPQLPPCCSDRSGPGCTTLPTHHYTQPDRAQMNRYSSYALTPSSANAVLSLGAQLDQTRRSPNTTKFRAVLLDCEMVGVFGGRSEVISICAADYFTGAVLLHRLVEPTQRVIAWRSSIHGISKSRMQAAISQASQGQDAVLTGWQEARSEMWKLIDDDTILVGHALQNDLDVLRMIHGRVVDSAILARDAVSSPSLSSSSSIPQGRQWGLKTLCTDLLGLEIRDNPGHVHDCLEDVLATREVVLWCVHHPDSIQKWAVRIRREEEEASRERQRKREEKEKKRDEEENESERARQHDTMNAVQVFAGGVEVTDLLGFEVEVDDKVSDLLSFEVEGNDNDEDRSYWSDIAEDLGYPKGFDPRSD
ncbi:exonuclease [Phlyctema vagabunda]|uniref:Exonuclease n=1 Tax=Phlyctema vagabunda TaxID=108571 RepID=A0ABR4P467_9HELO